MRTLEDRVNWFHKELVAGGHHLMPMQERIKIWTDGLALFMTREDIANRVKAEQDRNTRLHATGGQLMGAAYIEALTVLDLYATEVGIPYELMRAEMRLLQSAPGQAQEERR